MIIPGNALLALLSPPQESQGTGEEKGGFGTLLTEIEQHATSRPDQEETERRALESVLQVLMNIFQSCTPANLLPVAAAPGTGESGVVSMRPGGGLPLGLPPGRGTTPALWETGEVNLPSGMVSDGAQDIGQLAFPALVGQSTGPSPAIAGAPENFSWLLHRSESTQDLSGLFMAQPTAALSVSTPTAELSPLSGAPLPATTPSFSRDRVMATAEAQFVSPGLPQTSLATAGERPEAVREPLLPPLSPLSTQTSVGTQEEISQSTSLASQLSPVGTVHAVSWVGQAAAPPVAASAVPLPTIPQTEAATTSDAWGTMALVQEDTTPAEYDVSPAPRHLPASQERTAETMPSLAPLTTDYALPLSSARATSHTPAAEPAIATPPSHSLEDMGRPWPSPFSANTIILHLEPRELGGLLLQVRVNDKRLIASFQAQSPEAETLLRSHLPSLQESLSQHGFEVQPIAVTRAAEEFSAHMGAGTGAFAHQHSAFQAFAEDRQATNAGETQGEVDLHRTLRAPSEPRRRLLDVVI